MDKRIRSALCAGILVLGLVSMAEAALEGRLEANPGAMDYQAYYDTDLDITWAADANINGEMDWNTATPGQQV